MAERTLNYPFEDLGATCLAAAQTIREQNFEPDAVMAAAEMVETSYADLPGGLVDCCRGDMSTHDILIGCALTAIDQVHSEEWSNFESVADTYEAIGKLLEAAGRL